MGGISQVNACIGPLMTISFLVTATGGIMAIMINLNYTFMALMGAIGCLGCELVLIVGDTDA